MQCHVLVNKHKSLEVPCWQASLGDVRREQRKVTEPKEKFHFTTFSNVVGPISIFRALSTGNNVEFQDYLNKKKSGKKKGTTCVQFPLGRALNRLEK